MKALFGTMEQKLRFLPQWAAPPQDEREPMLVLSRNPQEALVIDDSIRIVILEVNGNRVRLGIAAPSDVPIFREECANSRASIQGTRRLAPSGPRTSHGSVSSSRK